MMYQNLPQKLSLCKESSPISTDVYYNDSKQILRQVCCKSIISINILPQKIWQLKHLIVECMLNIKFTVTLENITMFAPGNVFFVYISLLKISLRGGTVRKLGLAISHPASWFSVPSSTDLLCH
jgi:hypothetical protein